MANSMAPDQTAPIRAVCSGSMLFASICNLSVLVDLILYIPSTIFQLCRDGSSLVESVLS